MEARRQASGTRRDATRCAVEGTARTEDRDGLTIAPEADETAEGPAYFKVTDPDGNTLLFDQHVPSPKR